MSKTYQVCWVDNAQETVHVVTHEEPRRAVLAAYRKSLEPHVHSDDLPYQLSDFDVWMAPPSAPHEKNPVGETEELMLLITHNHMRETVGFIRPL